MLSAINDTTDGVFLGLGLFHMMPEMIETASHLGFHFSFALLSCFAIIVSFVILSVIYQKFRKFFKPDCLNDSPEAPERYSSLGLLLSAILILSFHSVSEGVALGFVSKSEFFYVLFAAIGIHKWLESFVVASALNGYQSQITIYMIMLAFSCMTPLGLIAGDMGLHLILQQSHEFNLVLYTFSSAIFIYIGMSSILASIKINKGCNVRYVTLGLLLILFFEMLGYFLGA